MRFVLSDAAATRSKVPLHPLERTLLLSLASEDENWVEIERASQGSGLSLDQVRRAVEWLKPKSLIDVETEEAAFVRLGPEGAAVLASGFPERKLVGILEQSGGKSTMDVVSKKLGPEFSVALGQARRNNWIIIDGPNVALNPEETSGEGEKRKNEEELLLEKLKGSEKLQLSKLTDGEKTALANLEKRHKGLVSELKERTIKIRLNPRGREVSVTINKDEIDEITPEVILSGSWRTKPLRSIDVSSPAPAIYGGRRHPIRMFMDEVKEAFVSLGFEEIEGAMAQSSLWNFDALFIPQQHPTREMQDTFYLAGSKADVSRYRREMESIKSSHEAGGATGSLGWRYKWSEDEAERVVLRTHTTAVTIRYLSDHKPSEARVFSVGKVFRNEKPNYKHLPEFYQIEGVMVGPKLNVRNLIYIISKFYSKLGFDKVKFWPTYFPYTEPSLQTVAFYEKKQKWLELGGMGVFRPEVTVPLGVVNPVLAWGLGMDRLVMLRYDLEDIRELYGPNLGWLRNTGVVGP